MRASTWIHIVRFVVLAILQVLIFRRLTLSLGGTAYVHFMIYPLAVMLMPIKTPRIVLMLAALLLGLFVDGFYNSPGVHASAIVLLAYVRKPLLNLLEPYEGYNEEVGPSLRVMGVTWFMSFLAASLAIYLFVYFSVEAFSFVYLLSIVLDTLVSLLASFFVMLLIEVVFSSRA